MLMKFLVNEAAHVLAGCTSEVLRGTTAGLLLGRPVPGYQGRLLVTHLQGLTEAPVGGSRQKE